MQPLSFSKDLVFESERLSFRGISSDDTENLVRWRSRKDVYEYSNNPKPITVSEHLLWLSGYMARSNEFRAIITDKVTGKDIGMLGGIYKNGAFVTSYYIGELEYRGKGLAVEAIQALIVFLNMIKITKIQAYTHVNNIASISCLIKIGFRLVSCDGLTRLYEYVM